MSKIAELTLEFDADVYRLTAVKKAAYKFGDRCHIQIEKVDERQTRITLRAKRETEELVFLAGEFQNEVLDQELREIIGKETEGIRNLLLAQAFSETSLLDPHGENADEKADPINIRPSDEQKNEKRLSDLNPDSQSSSE